MTDLPEVLIREYIETGTYTASMENRIYDVMDLDEDAETCRQELLEVVSSFRPLDQVLEDLLIRKGFSGDRDSVDEKYAFARMLFITKGVPVPRNLKSFLAGTARFDRDKKTPFQFCIAFGLTVEEAEVFFRRCCLGRGFDYHSMQDLVVAFGLTKKLSYQEISELLDQVPDQKPGAIPDSADILYTEEIENTFAILDEKEDLLIFLRENADRFAYNNATACKKIREIWKELTDPVEGLLNKEIKELSADSYEETDVKAAVKKKWSEETALKQILGLQDKTLFRNFSNKRSLKEILKDNPLLHPLAADCFPNRNAVRNILDGKHVSYESVRKLLILLLFYQYWIKKALEIQDKNIKNRKGTSGEFKNFWQSAGTDGDRCLNQIDRYLDEAGYPGLYYGNPYDWLFLFAMVSEEPLPAFRGYMLELYIEAKEGAHGPEGAFTGE